MKECQDFIYGLREHNVRPPGRVVGFKLFPPTQLAGIRTLLLCLLIIVSYVLACALFLLCMSLRS